MAKFELMQVVPFGQIFNQCNWRHFETLSFLLDGFIPYHYMEVTGRMMKRRIECIVCRAQVCDATLSVGAIIDFDRMERTGPG